VFFGQLFFYKTFFFGDFPQNGMGKLLAKVKPGAPLHMKENKNSLTQNR